MSTDFIIFLWAQGELFPLGQLFVAVLASDFFCLIIIDWKVIVFNIIIKEGFIILAEQWNIGFY